MLCSNACFPLSGAVSTGVAGASCSLSAVLGAGRKEGASLASLWPLEAIGKAPTDIIGVTEVCHSLHPNEAVKAELLHLCDLKGPYSVCFCLWLLVP